VEIRRITDQPRTLEEFYGEMSALGHGNDFSKVGARTLGLLGHLRAIEGPPIWAVTSLASLNFVADNDWRLPVLVSIQCGGNWFAIEYRMPPNEAPWPEAFVRGQTDDMARACEMVAFGLTKATGTTHTVNRPLTPESA
jgi:hypothetical protein